MTTHAAASLICLVAVLLMDSSEALNLGKCPPQPLESLVAEYFRCHPLRRYHCLFDSLRKIYSIHCFSALKQPAGSYVYLEGRLNSRSCPKSRYQPKPYWSSDFNECVYQKSQCNGEGQVIHNNGTTYKDRFCRCDYTRGYDFLYKPKNTCYCEPNLEDCTCYLKKCPNNVKRLTPDYECGSPGGLVTCPVLPSIIDETTTVDRPESFWRDFRLDNTLYNISGRNNGVKKSVVIVIVIITLSVIIIALASLIVKELLEMKGLTYEQVSAKAEIKLAISDDCYIEPSNYDDIKYVIEKEKLLILTGKKGSGKLTIALHLANKYLKNNYKCILLKSENISQKLFFPRGKEKYLVVLKLAYSFDDPENKAEREQIRHLFGYSGEIKIIIIADSIYPSIADILRKEKSFNVSLEKVAFDIKYAEQAKADMLDNYLKKFQTTHACSGSKRKEILDCEPLFGFPLMCCDFCSDPEVTELGTLFFILPPEKLVCEMDQMFEHGRNNIVVAYIFCALVFILTESNSGPVVLDIGRIEGLISQIFNIQIKVMETTIRKATHILLAKYTELNHDGLYSFQHQSIYDAILISYGNMFPKIVVKNCTLKSLMLLGRPKSYRPKKGEKTFCLPIDRKDILQGYTHRLLQDLLQSDKTAANVGDYLKSFSTNYNDQILLNSVFKQLSKAALMKEQYSTQLLIFFSKFLDCPYDSKLTSDRELHIFIASWQVLSASRYNNGKALDQVINDIIDSNLETQVLLTKVDRFDNTVFHYFCVWCYEREERFLLKLLNSISQKSFSFQPIVANSKKQSPFDIVSYLGRPKIFERLVPFYKKSFKKPNITAAFHLIELLEQAEKQATKAVNTDDSKLLIDFAFCRELPVFASSTNYTLILNVIDKEFKSWKGIL